MRLSTTSLHVCCRRVANDMLCISHTATQIPDPPILNFHGSLQAQAQYGYAGQAGQQTAQFAGQQQHATQPAPNYGQAPAYQHKAMTSSRPVTDSSATAAQHQAQQFHNSLLGRRPHMSHLTVNPANSFGQGPLHHQAVQQPTQQQMHPQAGLAAINHAGATAQKPQYPPAQAAAWAQSFDPRAGPRPMLASYGGPTQEAVRPATQQYAGQGHSATPYPERTRLQTAGVYQQPQQHQTPAHVPVDQKPLMSSGASGEFEVQFLYG